MKTLTSVAAFLFATLAWAWAAIDFLLANVAEKPRPYLLPARTFHAAFRASRAYLTGQSLDLRAFTVRKYPRHDYFWGH